MFRGKYPGGYRRTKLGTQRELDKPGDVQPIKKMAWGHNLLLQMS